MDSRSKTVRLMRFARWELDGHSRTSGCFLSQLGFRQYPPRRAHSYPLNLWDVLLQTGKLRREEKEIADRIDEVLDFAGLRIYRDDLAKNLPYGRQKVVEIARALMARPKVLLLDEPAAGLNSSEKGNLMTLLRKIRDSGVSILLIEHEMALVEALSDHVFVLNYGRMISQGTFAEIKKDLAVVEAYLGTGGSHA